MALYLHWEQACDPLAADSCVAISSPCSCGVIGHRHKYITYIHIYICKVTYLCKLNVWCPTLLVNLTHNIHINGLFVFCPFVLCVCSWMEPWIWMRDVSSVQPSGSWGGERSRIWKRLWPARDFDPHASNNRRTRRTSTGETTYTHTQTRLMGNCPGPAQLEDAHKFSGKIWESHTGQKTATAVNFPFYILCAHFTVNSFESNTASAIWIRNRTNRFYVIKEDNLCVALKIVVTDIFEIILEGYTSSCNLWVYFVKQSFKDIFKGYWCSLGDMYRLILTNLRKHSNYHFSWIPEISQKSEKLQQLNRKTQSLRFTLWDYRSNQCFAKSH